MNYYPVAIELHSGCKFKLFTNREDATLYLDSFKYRSDVLSQMSSTSAVITDADVNTIKSFIEQYIVENNCESLYRALCVEFSAGLREAHIFATVSEDRISSYQFDNLLDTVTYLKDHTTRLHWTQVSSIFSFFTYMDMESLDDYVIEAVKRLQIDNVYDAIKSVAVSEVKIQSVETSNNSDIDIESIRRIQANESIKLSKLFNIIECLPEASIENCQTSKDLIELLKKFL